MELDRCFDELNAKLFICFTCLSSDDSFVAFDKSKLLYLSQFFFNLNIFSITWDYYFRKQDCQERVYHVYNLLIGGRSLTLLLLVATALRVYNLLIRGRSLLE